MSKPAEMSSVAYKNGNLMRYTLWALAAVAIAVLITTFMNMMNGNISAAVPQDYKFAVTDNYNDGSRIRTTYYIYDDHILVEDESFIDNEVNRTVMIYEGINTSSLSLDSEDTLEICELGVCKEHPKVLTTIKRLISRKVGREYISL